jgi:hypothetical protein
MARSVLPTPPSTPNARSPLEENLAQRKKQIIDRVMAKFTVLFQERMDELCDTGDQPADDGDEHDSSGSSGRSAANGKKPADRPTRTSKRSFNSDSDDNSADDGPGKDGNRGNRRGGTDRVDIKRLRTARKLACPFFKHNPEKYGRKRTCCGPGWDTVSRLK